MISENKERIAITLTKEQADKLKHAASSLGITKSALIQIAITEYINKNQKEIKFDLGLGSGGIINKWSFGFFEKTATIAGNSIDNSKFVTVGNCRIEKNEYEKNKEAFDNYINRNKL